MLRNQLKTTYMKTKERIVPKEIIEEFSDLIAEHEIANSIQGSTEDGEIIVEIQYEKEERQGVYVLMELIDDYNEEDE